VSLVRMSPKKVKGDGKGKDRESERSVTWVDEHSKPAEPVKFV